MAGTTGMGGQGRRPVGVAAAPLANVQLTNTVDPTQQYPKFGPLPGVVEVVDQTGSWDTVGRTRMLRLSDGGHVIETHHRRRPPHVLRVRAQRLPEAVRQARRGRARGVAVHEGAGGHAHQLVVRVPPETARGLDRGRDREAVLGAVHAAGAAGHHPHGGGAGLPACLRARGRPGHQLWRPRRGPRR